MLRRFVIMLTLLLTLPAFANATWYVTASASRSTGDTTSRVSPAGSTAMAGFSGFKNISTIAGAGFQVNRVTIDGISQTLSPGNFYTVTQTAGVSKTYRSVVAYFGPATLGSASITVNRPANSSYRVISPVNASLTNVPVGANRTIAIIPLLGYAVTVAAGDISPAGACTTAASQQFLGAVDVTCNSIQAPITIGGSSAISQVVTAYAGADRTVAANGSTSLSGSASYLTGTPAYSWAVTAGPAGATLGTPAAQNTTFSAATPGTYTVTLSVTAAGVTGTDTVDVVVTDPAANDATYCASCHTSRNLAVINAFNSAGAVHKANNVSCSTCHDPSATGHYTFNGTTNPPQCSTCHGQYVTNAGFTATCARCHTSADIHGVTAAIMTPDASCTPCHSAYGAFAHYVTKANPDDCLDCHASVAPKHGANGVADNNGGVRAITGEFTKWSHHVTGVTLNNAHCAACHLAGKAVNGAIVIDSTKHMVDGNIHLRNAQTDADMLWNPASPNHTTMDNYCMSCHSAAGASSAQSALIRKANPAFHAMSTANNATLALNPFLDTISNQYDKMLRGRVVNVDDQFTATNVSHHAVKAKKYTGRTREAGDPRAIASAANPLTFASYSGLATFANTSSTQGEYNIPRKTIYEAGRFVDTYRTLSPAVGTDTTLGDDSPLHCGDCHTVGQWKANSSVNADGSATTVVIGAHGSQNEYMLRNSIGTDELHRGAKYSYSPFVQAGGADANAVAAGTAVGSFAGVQFGSWEENGEPRTTVNLSNQSVAADEVPTAKPFLVCYNCHVYTEYGSVYFSNTAGGGREGSHAFGDHTRGNYCNGPYNTSGSGRATTWTAVYGQQVTGATGTFMGIANFNFGRLQPGTAANLAGGTSETSATYWALGAGVTGDDTLKTQGTGINKIVLLADGTDAVADATTAYTGTARKLTTTLGAYQGMNGSGAGGSNIFQIQCLACHNSGPANGFGGIHGSKINTYTDAAGQTSNARRFLPGLGNFKWVPGTPWATEGQQWEQEANVSTFAKSRGGAYQAGCYTLGTKTTNYNAKGTLPAASEGGTTTGTGNLMGTWGSCTDHDNSVDGLERTIIRPVSY